MSSVSSAPSAVINARAQTRSPLESRKNRSSFSWPMIRCFSKCIQTIPGPGQQVAAVTFTHPERFTRGSELPQSLPNSRHRGLKLRVRLGPQVEHARVPLPRLVA